MKTSGKPGDGPWVIEKQDSKYGTLYWREGTRVGGNWVALGLATKYNQDKMARRVRDTFPDFLRSSTRVVDLSNVLG